MARARDPITGVTLQQEAFSKAIALGHLHQNDAYRSAYDVSSDTLASTVNEEASRLVHNPNVAARIQQLKASLQAEALVSAADLVRELLEVGTVKVPAGQVRASDKVAALDKVAKILGLYKDTDERDTRPEPITQVTIILTQGGKQVEESRIVEQVAKPLEPGLEQGQGDGSKPGGP